MIKSFEVWSAGDGYDISPACHGIGRGENFYEACKELFARKNAMRGPFAPKNTLYNEVNNTYYGCQLFHNHVEAQDKTRRSRPDPVYPYDLAVIIRVALEELSEHEANSSCNDDDKSPKAFEALDELVRRLKVAEKTISDAGWERSDGGFS